MFLLRVTFISNMATAKPEVVLSATSDAILTSFQVQRRVLRIYWLKRSVTNDAVLQTKFTLSMAALKFNMAAKPGVVLTAASEATLLPF